MPVFKPVPVRAVLPLETPFAVIAVLTVELPVATPLADTAVAVFDVVLDVVTLPLANDTPVDVFDQILSVEL